MKAEFPEDYKNYTHLSPEEKIKYIFINLNRFDVGYNIDVYQEMKNILYPLFLNTLNEETSKELYIKWVNKSKNSLDNILNYRTILYKYDNSVVNKTIEDMTRLNLLYYLAIIESVFTDKINITTYLLICSGIPYYRQNKITKNISDVDDYEKVKNETLYNKLGFLKDNGFSKICDFCDRKLRNAIAHMEFVVDPKGSVFYDGGTSVVNKSFIDVNNMIEKLLEVTQSFSKIMGEAYLVLNNEKTVEIED